MSGSDDKSEPGQSIHVVSEPTIGHVEKQAEIGFTNGGVKYDTYRPSYTDESVDLIVLEILSSSPEEKSKGSLRYDVLELGAGTGKMTERLSKKLPDNVKYLASDMSEDFLDVLKAKGLGVDVVRATSDSIPLEDKSVGSVVCAQSFHWFSSKKDIESIHRALAPGGKLILIWNIRDLSPEWIARLKGLPGNILQTLEGSLKFDVNSQQWAKDIDSSTLFKLHYHKSLPGVHVQGDLETVLAGFTTSSSYKFLPADERDMFLDQFREAVKSFPDVDTNNVTVPYKTELFVYLAE